MRLAPFESFGKPMRTILIALLMTLATQVGAKNLILKNDGKTYIYENPKTLICTAKQTIGFPILEKGSRRFLNYEYLKELESTAKLIFTPLDNAIPLWGNNFFHWTHEVQIKNSKNLKSFENRKAKGFCLNFGTFSEGIFKPGDLKCARDYGAFDLGLDMAMGKKKFKEPNASIFLQRLETIPLVETYGELFFETSRSEKRLARNYFTSRREIVFIERGECESF